MDPKTLTDELAEADRHVASGQQLVQRQIELVEQLARDARETVRATELLSLLQEALAAHSQKRDRLRRLLTNLEQLRVIKKSPRWVVLAFSGTPYAHSRMPLGDSGKAADALLQPGRWVAMPYVSSG